MKPGGLVRMTHNISLQIPHVPARLVKKRVPIPRRWLEIPKGRYNKDHNPEQKERCFWIYQRPEPGHQPMPLWQESQWQKEHAKEPTHRVPRITPGKLPVVRRASPSANH